MSVTFEEQGPIARLSPSNGRGIVAWMVRNHIADTVSHAQTILLVGIVIIITITAVISKSSLSKKAVDTHKNFVPAVIR